MNISLNFDGNNFLCGFYVGFILFGGHSLWWLSIAALMVIDFNIKGMPYIKLKYDNDTGFTVKKCKYK